MNIVELKEYLEELIKKGYGSYKANSMGYEFTITKETIVINKNQQEIDF